MKQTLSVIFAERNGFQSGNSSLFVETNLGTLIAVPASLEITAGNFKRIIERAHIASFPQLGFLTIDAVMVKQNSCFYHLPDSLPLKHVCQGFRKFWFLHVKATPNKLEKICPSGHLVSERRDSRLHVNKGKEVIEKSADSTSRKRRLKRIWCLNALLRGLVATACPLKKKKQRRRRRTVKKFPAGFCPEKLEQESHSLQGQISAVCERNGNYQQELLHQENYQHEVLHLAQISNSNATTDTPLESFSEAVSVSGIIDRYFANLIEVDQIGSSSSSEVASESGRNQFVEQAEVGKTSSSKHRTKKQHPVHETCQSLLPSPLPEDSKSFALRSKYERSEVGKRLVVALKGLGLCQSKQGSRGSSLSKGKRLWNPDAESVIRSLVFEINDND